MKKIIFSVMLIAVGACCFAQPAPKSAPSAYQQVNELKRELNLNESQVKKAYKAYAKYNNAVFGNTSASGELQVPLSGGRPGEPGGAPMGGPGQMGGRPGGNGGAPMNGRPGGAPQGGNRQFSGGFPDGAPQSAVSAPENMEKMQKTMDKQEVKLDKSMKKLFKNDDAKYAQWQKIRERQRKEMIPVPPMLTIER